jgi:hypothetical protein
MLTLALTLTLTLNPVGAGAVGEGTDSVEPCLQFAVEIHPLSCCGICYRCNTQFSVFM